MRRIQTLLLTVAMSVAITLGSATTTAAGPSAPADLTGAEVCALIDQSFIEAVLDAAVDTVSPSESGTPQCSYSYQSASGTFTNVVVAVMRVEDDLGGRVGTKAFKYAVAQNKTYAGKAKFKALKGVGEQAVFIRGSSRSAVIVLSHTGHVITIFGSSLTKQSAQALAGEAIGIEHG